MNINSVKSWLAVDRGCKEYFFASRKYILFSFSFCIVKDMLKCYEFE